MQRLFSVIILITISAVLLVQLLPASATTSSSTCTAAPSRFRFKPVANPGTPSFITDENHKDTIKVISRPDPQKLPPIILELLFFDEDRQEYVRDLSLDGHTVEAQTIPQQLRVTGGNIEINQGEALFSSLQIYENDPAVTYQLRFTVIAPPTIRFASGPLRLTTGDIEFIAASNKDSFGTMRFGNYGYLSRGAHVAKTIPVRTPIPYFFMELLTPSGHRKTLSSSQPCSLTVVSSIGTVSPSTFTANLDGIVIIKDLVFTPPLTMTVADSPPQNVVLTFRADNGVGWTHTVQSMPLRPQLQFEGDRFMLFDESPSTTSSTSSGGGSSGGSSGGGSGGGSDGASFFLYDNVGNSAVKKIRMPPISIQLYTSNMEKDTSNNYLIVEATTDQGTLSGAEAIFSEGRAVFEDLMFIDSSPRSSVITFKARNTRNSYQGGGLPNAEELVLYSGSVQVAETAIGQKILTFSKGSFIQENKDLTIKKNTNGDFTIKSIIVQVKNSAYQIDPTANGIELGISSPGSGVTANPSTAFVSNGVAAFMNVKFTGALIDQYEFQIIDRSSVREPISSGKISLKFASASADTELRMCGDDVNTPCTVKLQFSDSSVSYAYEENQELFGSVDGKIPDIRIKLLDQFEEPMTELSEPPRLVAFTADSPEQEIILSESSTTAGSGFHEGLWRKGEFVFGCLLFKQRPSGLVRLKFRLLFPTSTNRYRVADLQTGFVTITEKATPNFGLRFARQGSLFAYTGQPSSAVINVALPSITIEMVNSLHEFDDTNSDVVIVAHATSGELDPDGSREVMKNGQATFSTLKFITIANEPVIYFTALQSTSLPVAGKSVVTGTLTVTTLPIDQFEIVFSPVLSKQNNVTYQFQDLDLKSSVPEGSDVLRSEPILASILVRRSDHQVEPTVNQELTIELFCDEAAIGSRPSFTLTTNDPSSVNFSNTITPESGTASGFREPYNEAYFRYVVTQSDSPFLTGKSLTIGPIRLQASTTETCSTQLEKPTAVAEMVMSVEDFTQLQAPFRARIAYIMAVEVERVTVANVRKTTVVDYVSLSRRDGIKVDISFTKPFSTSSNKKSSAALNREFLSVQPNCDEDAAALTPTTPAPSASTGGGSGSTGSQPAATPAPTTQRTNLGLCFVKLYPKSKEVNCSQPLFTEALAQAEKCTLTGSECACYAEHVFEQSNGATCAADPTLEDDVFPICEQLSTCRVPSVQGICDPILATRTTSMVWLWATLGSLAGVIVIVIILYKEGIIHGKRRATLHTTLEE